MRRVAAGLALIMLVGCGGTSTATSPSTTASIATTAPSPTTTPATSTVPTTIPATTTTSQLTSAEAAFVAEARQLGGTGTNADLLSLGKSVCLAAKSGAAESLAVTLAGNQQRSVRQQYALIITAAGDKLCPEYSSALILAASKVAQLSGP